MVAMSFLSSRPFRIALLAGVGLTISGLLYSYYKKQHTVVEDIVASHDNCADSNIKLRDKLKKLLRKENVFCADIDCVEEIIDNLVQGGPDQLQVIADFDRTMTPMTHNGKPVPSCHCVIAESPDLPEWFKEKSFKMKEYYLAIECDPSLTNQEKLPFMVEWWNKAHDLLVSCSIMKKNIVDAVAASNLYLRDGSSKFLRLLYEKDIPLLVFSAGVGDVIEQALKQRYILYDNIHIIANWMEFNHEGALIGFKGDPIHVFNKNTHALENASYFDNIQHRHNVILLGDSLGDLDIAEGLTIKKNLLTIGYLNHHIEANLPQYKAGYDIVLAEEDGIELIQLLLANITNL